MKIKLKKKNAKLSCRSVTHQPNGKFAPGNPYGGRPKGSKNKFTTLKQAFVNAFDRVGGEEALIEFFMNARGTSNRRDFFNWIARMLPAEVKVNGLEDVAPNQLAGVTDGELDGIIQRGKRVRSNGDGRKGKKASA